MAYSLSLYAIAVLLVSILVAQIVANRIAAARFQKLHGCKPEHKIPQFERIIGYDLYKIQTNASKNKHILEVGQKRYEANGITWSAAMMGKTFFNTIDPENIKAVLATNFKDFGLGERIEAFGPLLGHGIFTTVPLHYLHDLIRRDADSHPRMAHNGSTQGWASDHHLLHLRC